MMDVILEKDNVLMANDSVVENSRKVRALCSAAPVFYSAHPHNRCSNAGIKYQDCQRPEAK